MANSDDFKLILHIIKDTGSRIDAMCDSLDSTNEKVDRLRDDFAELRVAIATKDGEKKAQHTSVATKVMVLWGVSCFAMSTGATILLHVLNLI